MKMRVLQVILFALLITGCNSVEVMDEEQVISTDVTGEQGETITLQQAQDIADRLILDFSDVVFEGLNIDWIYEVIPTKEEQEKRLTAQQQFATDSFIAKIVPGYEEICDYECMNTMDFPISIEYSIKDELVKADATSFTLHSLIPQQLPEDGDRSHMQKLSFVHQDGQWKLDHYVEEEKELNLTKDEAFEVVAKYGYYDAVFVQEVMLDILGQGEELVYEFKLADDELQFRYGITARTGYIFHEDLGIGPQLDSNVWDNAIQNDPQISRSTTGNLTNVMNQVYWFMYKKRLK